MARIKYFNTDTKQWEYADSANYVLTDVDVQKIAEQAAGMVEVPVGVSEEWEYIGEFTTPEDVESWVITEDADGSPIQLKKLYFELTAQPSEGATGNANLTVGNPAFPIWWGATQIYINLMAGLRTTKIIHSAHAFYIPAGDTYHMISCYSTAAASLVWGRAVNHGQYTDVDYFGGIAFKSGASDAAKIGAGSTVKIWGVRS